jgi:hypothetical protein
LEGRQVAGFDDADASGKIQRRFGKGIVLFPMVAGFAQCVFPQSVSKGQNCENHGGEAHIDSLDKVARIFLHITFYIFISLFR